MSTAIDAFKYEQALRAKGIPDAQATAFSAALSDAVQDSALVTKADLAEATSKIIMWVIGTQLAIMAATVAIVLRFTGHA
jgi:hypothetical protein